MALLQKADCGQIKLSEKITEGNSSLEKLGLTGEKDLKGTKKERGSEWEAERPE